MKFSELSNNIFTACTEYYHTMDNVDAKMVNPYPVKSIEYYLFLKNWIDAVQWHFEDIIRDPQIDPVAALTLKRRIDASNQERTDLVELLDSYFWDKYKEVKPADNATINTESPAWLSTDSLFWRLKYITCVRRLKEWMWMKLTSTNAKRNLLFC